MTRFAMVVEYDGGPYAGFQRQQNQTTVQSVLEEGLYALTGERQRVHCAGRTDAGVHGIGQVIHVDLQKDTWTAHGLLRGFNHYLKGTQVGIVHVAPVPHLFHARFSATSRCYLYRILNRRAPSPLAHGRALHCPVPLDMAAMETAATYLVGHHDFTSFRATHCQGKSPMRTLTTLTVHRRGDWMGIYAHAPSFLHHQVRNMVGSLILVGRGQWVPDDMRSALNARNRSAAGPTAPAHGLYFLGVTYDGSAVADESPVDRAFLSPVIDPLTFL